MKILKWLKVTEELDGRYFTDELWWEGDDESQPTDRMAPADLPGFLRRLADEIEESQQ